MYNILVCDDEKEITDAIEIYLSQEGYRVLKAYNGKQALEIMKKEEIHLLIIDLMMPEMDGLNVGADDYVTKPFNPLELVARVKSQMRRYTALGNIAETASEEENVFHSGGLVIDDNKKEVTVDGEPIRLTRIEYNILLFLLQNKGKVFSIEQIYEKIWKEEAFCADNTVTVHIRHIREKIEIDPKNPKYLKVMWGIGYKVEDLDS